MVGRTIHLKVEFLVPFSFFHFSTQFLAPCQKILLKILYCDLWFLKYLMFWLKGCEFVKKKLKTNSFLRKEKLQAVWNTIVDI